jgi:hypothetical protein
MGETGGLELLVFWLMRGESLVLPRGEGESPLVSFFQRGGGEVSSLERGVAGGWSLWFQREREAAAGWRRLGFF